MRYALVNPHWSFEGSIYFGCREPHLPLELGYAQALLEAAGHEVTVVDGQLWGLSSAEIVARVAAGAPQVVVVTTAPSYLFWRCAPPELRVPMQLVRGLRAELTRMQTAQVQRQVAEPAAQTSLDAGRAGGMAPLVVAVGPHGSSTPETTLRKLGVDVVVLGECEEVLPLLAGPAQAGLAAAAWEDVPSICYWVDGRPHVQGGPHASDMRSLPALRWERETLARHGHHHHRFDAPPVGPGAEIEFSRGCPYRCTFCAKEHFRNKYRKRPLAVVLEELDGLLAAGVTYVYFIDEIFLPDRALLEALCLRSVQFGVQTRIDLWDDELLELLGRAGCVSIEAGIESISARGRNLLEKRCKLSTEELQERLIVARRFVPFVQANLLDAGTDDPQATEAWRALLVGHGVWANKPVPLFPYPGSPDYVKRWGLPDGWAWERAHEEYLGLFREFSDIQEERPLPLPQLEGLALA